MLFAQLSFSILFDIITDLHETRRDVGFIRLNQVDLPLLNCDPIIPWLWCVVRVTNFILCWVELLQAMQCKLWCVLSELTSAKLDRLLWLLFWLKPYHLHHVNWCLHKYQITQVVLTVFNEKQIQTELDNRIYWFNVNIINIWVCSL